MYSPVSMKKFMIITSSVGGNPQITVEWVKASSVYTIYKRAIIDYIYMHCNLDDIIPVNGFEYFTYEEGKDDIAYYLQNMSECNIKGLFLYLFTAGEGLQDNCEYDNVLISIVKEFEDPIEYTQIE